MILFKCRFLSRCTITSSLFALTLIVISPTSVAQYPDQQSLMFYSKTTQNPELLQQIASCRQECGDQYYQCATTHCKEKEVCEKSCLSQFRSCYGDCFKQTTRKQFRANPAVNSFVIVHNGNN